MKSVCEKCGEIFSHPATIYKKLISLGKNVNICAACTRKETEKVLAAEAEKYADKHKEIKAEPVQEQDKTGTFKSFAKKKRIGYEVNK